VGSHRVALVLLLATAALLSVVIGGYVVLRPRALATEPAPLADDPACAAVAARWPDQVAGRPRVTVAGDPRGVAAWGDPVIVARCGVVPPPPSTNDCVAADGVDWVARGGGQPASGMVFVSYGRSPAIEVTVPAAYAPEPMVLGAFAEAARQIGQGEHRCR
jgi:hypothetical protein